MEAAAAPTIERQVNGFQVVALGSGGVVTDRKSICDECERAHGSDCGRERMQRSTSQRRTRITTCFLQSHQHWILDEELLDSDQHRRPLIPSLVLSYDPDE